MPGQLPSLLSMLSIATLLLSGCVTDVADSGTGTMPPDAAPRIPSEVDAAAGDLASESGLTVVPPSLVMPDYDVSDWFWVGAPAAPGGSLVATTWTVPDGAVQVAANGLESLVLEGAVIADMGSPEAFLLAFGEHNGTLVPVGVHTDLFVQTTTRAPLAAADATIAAPTYAPFFLPLVPVLAPPGTTLHLVFGVRDSAPSTAGMAFRVVDRPVDPRSDMPPGSADILFSAMSATGPGVMLPAFGVGEDWRIGMYRDENGLGLLGQEIWSTDLHVTNDAALDVRPVATLRETVLRFSHTTGPGWGSGFGFFAGFVAAGEWNLTVNVQGERMDASGVFAQVPTVGGVTNQLLGTPLWVATHEGQGGSSLAWTLRGGGPGFSEFFQLFFVSFGTPLSELTGFTTGTDLRANDRPLPVVA